MLNTLAFTGPLLMFPLLSGIMGLKVDRRSFYVAMVPTIIAFGIFTYFLPEHLSYLNTLLSIIVNGIFFFTSHISMYLYKKYQIKNKKIDNPL